MQHVLDFESVGMSTKRQRNKKWARTLSPSFLLSLSSMLVPTPGVEYVTENLEHTSLGVARESLTIYYSCRWD